MKKNIISFIVGFIFSIGLGVSGMTRPDKILGFLDLFGSFDPSLLFVMVGAIFVHYITYKLIRKKDSPLLHTEWLVPTKKEITPALVIGAFIFGIGWALGGYCPGPALTGLASFQTRPLIFVASMIIGMLIFKWINSYLKFQR